MKLIEIIKKEIEAAKVSYEERKKIIDISEKIIKTIEEKIKKYRIEADVFVGGSLAKETLIKKKSQDVDLFVRFNKKYSENHIKKLMKKIFFWFYVKGEKIKVKKIKGSRDYYKILFKKDSSISIEVVPTIMIKKPEEARNVTDLSYLHVLYVRKKIKNDSELKNEIILAKSFCHAQKCYGAESYISGFSGYALELLIIHYGSFLKFLSETAKAKEKIIIDLEKNYKNKEDILNNLNSAKIDSPIIIVDPTFKERNAAKALSVETFKKFQKSAKDFLENSSSDFFDYKFVDIVELKRKANNYGGLFACFEIKTKKQSGDIAGTKMKKFAGFLTREIEKYFDVIEKEFEYSGGKKSYLYLILKRKKEIIIEGPSIKMEKAVEGFKKAHPIWYIENFKIKSSLPVNISIREFLKQYKKKYRKTIKEMSISKISILDS